MRIGLLVLFVANTVVSSVALGEPAGPTRDLVAVGQLEHIGYEPIQDPEDLLGHGWITARLHVSRILHGRAADPIIVVRFVAHTYPVQGVTVRLKLRLAPDGTYRVRSFAFPGR